MTLIIQRRNSGSDYLGTGHADLCESGGPSPSSPLANTWGGTRNSASRLSDSIGLLKAVELVEAAQRAMAIGLPFNRHLTVHWRTAGLTDAEAASATGRLVKLILDWARRHGGTAYAWVRENGHRRRSHTHILLHVPRGLKLGLTTRWYRLSTGQKGRIPNAVKTVCIGGNAEAAFSGSDWYQANLAYVVGYILKGVDERSGIALGLDRYAEGGAIIGKRLSISGSLRQRIKKS